MKIEISIEKKHLYILAVLLVLFVSISMGMAGRFGTGASKVSHRVEEIIGKITYDDIEGDIPAEKIRNIDGYFISPDSLFDDNSLSGAKISVNSITVNRLRQNEQLPQSMIPEIGSSKLSIIDSSADKIIGRYIPDSFSGQKAFENMDISGILRLSGNAYIENYPVVYKIDGNDNPVKAVHPVIYAGSIALRAGASKTVSFSGNMFSAKPYLFLLAGSSSGSGLQIAMDSIKVTSLGSDAMTLENTGTQDIFVSFMALQDME